MHNVLETAVGSVWVFCVCQVAHTSVFFVVGFFLCVCVCVFLFFGLCVTGMTLSVAPQVFYCSRQPDKCPAGWCWLFPVFGYSLIGLSAAAMFCFLPLVLKLLPFTGQTLSNTETFTYLFYCMPDWQILSKGLWESRLCGLFLPFALHDLGHVA